MTLAHGSDNFSIPLILEVNIINFDNLVHIYPASKNKRFLLLRKVILLKQFFPSILPFARIGKGDEWKKPNMAEHLN